MRRPPFWCVQVDATRNRHGLECLRQSSDYMIGTANMSISIWVCRAKERVGGGWVVGEEEGGEGGGGLPA